VRNDVRTQASADVVGRANEDDVSVADIEHLGGAPAGQTRTHHHNVSELAHGARLGCGA
jgi:hypothetical protein